MLDDEPFQITPEEIEAASRALADIIAQNISHIQNNVINKLHVYDIIPEDQIEQLIDLDLLASSVHGITDILGQISGWFQSIIDSARNLIVSGITGFINQFVMPAINAIRDWLSRALPDIGRALGEIPLFISEKIMGALRSISTFFTVDLPGFFAKVRDFFTRDIPNFFSRVTDFFIRDLPSYFSRVTDFFTRDIPNFFSRVTDFFTRDLPGYFRTAIDFFTRDLPGFFRNVTDFFTRDLPGFFRGVTDFFTRDLPNYFRTATDFFTRDLPGFFRSVTDFFTRDLPNFFKGVTDFFTRDLPNYFRIVTDFFTKDIPNLFSRVTDFFTRDLPGYFRTALDFFTRDLPALFRTVTDFFTRDIPNFFRMVSDFFIRDLPGYFRIITDFFTKDLPGFFRIVVDFFTKDIPNFFKMVTEFFTKTMPDFFKGVVEFFTKTIPDLFKGVTDFFTKTIPQFFGMVSDFFTKTMPSFFTGVSEFFTKTLPQMFGSVIEFFTKTLPQFFGTVVDFFTKTIPQLFGGVIEFFTKTLPQFFGGVVDFFTKTLPQFFTGVSDFFTKVLPGWIEGARKGVTDFIDLLLGLPARAPEILKTVGTFLYNTIIEPMFQGIKTYLIDPMASGIGNMSGVLASVGSAFQGFMNAILKFPEWFHRNLVEPLLGGLAKIGEWIWNALPGWFKDALTAITNFFTKDLVNFFTKTLPEFFDSLAKGFQEFIKDPLGWFQRNVIDPLVKGLSALGQWIWERLPDWLKNAITAIQDFFTKTVPEFFKSIAEGFQEFVRDPLGWLQRNLVTPLVEGFSALGQWIWERLPDWFKNAITAIQDFFTKTVPEFFKSVAEGFQEFIRDPLGWFKKNLITPILEGFNALGKWIWDALPDWLRGGLEAVGNVFASIAETVVNLFKDPLGALQRTAESLWGGLQWLGQKIWEGLQWLGGVIWRGLTTLGETIWRGISGALEWFTNAVVEFGTRLVGGVTNLVIGGLKKIGDTIIKAIVDFTNWLIEASQKCASHIGTAITNLAAALVKPFEEILPTQLGAPLVTLVDEVRIKKQTQEMLGALFKLLVYWGGAIAGSQALATGAWALLHGIATPLDKITITTPIRIMVKAKGKGKITPVGVGAEGGGEGAVNTGVLVPLRINLGLFIRHIASEIRKYADTIGRALAYGMGIWISQPFMRFANAAFRNILIVELPTLEMILEILRRHLPHERFKEVLEIMRDYLALYGYNEKVVRWLTLTAEEGEEEGELVIKVRDRFGAERKIPLSMIYNLPSASDVARMAIRDIFGMGKEAMEEFTRIFHARGMHPDIGVLYYLLHYRYPPPERLWTFVCRGISGLLWATIPPDMLSKIRAEAEKLGAGIPTNASFWNFRGKELLTALQIYMTWQDFARFSWIKGGLFGWPADFTSDNQIMIDTLADIPTKIDQRWMVRFGLYQLLSERGVAYTSDVREFCEKVVESAQRGKVLLDLTNFCRTLQATGLHPYYVPITAVAETINAITDERTLLRTGILNLYKEGFLDSGAISRIGEGIVMTSFQVAYFDPAAYTWKTGYINVPLRYLGMEAQLIGLRAIMDRALDILRDIQRDALTAYQEFVITTKEEFKEKLSEIINDINTIYEQEYSKIIGESPPPELKLKYVDSYYESYLKALEIWRDVFTTRRIRTWAQRWIGWAMYRAAYGNVTKEDILKLVSLVGDYAKLTEREIQFIQSVLEVMYGIAQRDTVAEYLPTPSTMATLSEYLTLDANLVKKVLEERGIPDEWQDIWLRYISVKPVKSDAKALLSTYVRAFRYGAITKEALDAFISTLPQYGFTNKEIELIRKAAELEEQIIEARENRREYIPTPSMLATLAEYVAISPDIIQKVLETRNVPQEWRPIWTQYITVRPIADDVRALISTFRRVSLYVKIPDEIAKQVMEYAKLIGFTERELAILDLRNKLEEMLIEYRESRHEYLPTPSTIAILSEYITLDTELVKKVLTERGIPDEWQNIWLRYISVRPIKSDARSLLSTYVKAFRYGAITKDMLDAFISTLPQYGFTNKEIELIRKAAELEELIIEARENRREYLPTPSMLASMAEYVVISEELIQKVFTARHVPLEWQEIWRRYIDVRPIADDVKALISTYRRVSLYVKIPDEIAKQVLEYAKLIGFTEKELAILDLRNRLEEMLIEYRESRREYIPTPSMLASMAEYVTIPEDFIQRVFDARHIPPEWQAIWRHYINIRPIVDDVRGLLSAYRRALLYVTIPDDVKKKVEEYANVIGFTKTEWDILTLRVTLEEMIQEARENRREYIPTPMTLATLCEYIPEAREFFDDVVRARRIPAEWQKLWAKYIDLRPLIDDIRKYLSRAEQLYIRFMMKKDDFQKILDEVAKNLGYTPKEVEFLMRVTEFERYANAWRELIGTVDRLVSLSEYSPKAAKYALGKVYEMIDALPLSQTEKQELKAMWEEYIRNRPVKSEARLYITQLSNAYAEGLVSEADFSRELDAMKQWGFSDDEIMFYKARAALMKARKLKIPIIWE